MGQFLEYVKIAYKSIVTNKGRTFLTMLGIIIGISSVIMITGLGSGVKNAISGSMSDLFSGQTYIQAKNDQNITIEDIEYIKENVPGLKMCTPREVYSGTASSVKGDFYVDYTLANETHEFYAVEGLLHGRYFTEEEVRRGDRVGVIDEVGAKAFFGSDDVVGQTVIVDLWGDEIEYTIVGVRKAKDSQLLNMADALSSTKYFTLEVPYSSYEKATGETWLTDYMSEMLVSSDSPDINNILQRIVAILEARHDCRGEESFYIDSFESFMEKINKVIGYITLFVGFVSAISLVVGGVGVMNIMLVSVTERTSEIGIRKALGARTGSIMTQFLAESGMITFVGGILGVLLGYGGAALLCFIVSKVVKMSIYISVNIFIALGAALFSAGIGLFFGIFPARKAATLSPIEALRQE
ncbi:MAG: ABC transporter permease [Lachnospiraceae bacterium]|nr:ABC transporter permease [Lachnospiraceae bacterium]